VLRMHAHVQKSYPSSTPRQNLVCHQDGVSTSLSLSALRLTTCDTLGKRHAMASALTKPIEVKDSPLVVQYEAKAGNGFACDGEHMSSVSVSLLVISTVCL
jgi:hypothetical protein